MDDPFASRRAAFRALHAQGCFVIPNPWDVGSGMILEQLGFAALASSSAGLAFTHGLPDSPAALGRDLVLDHLRALVRATAVPINADYQSGYGDTPEDVAESVGLCIDTGVAGLSIEDATGNSDPNTALFPIEEAVRRVRAARAAIDAAPRSGKDVMLTARAECFLVGHPSPLDESIARLRAYADAGADVLFAPGVRDREGMRAIIDAVAPRPVNVLMSASSSAPDRLRVADLAALGARRVSVGSALARVAWTAFLKSAKSIANHGDFVDFEGSASTQEMSRWFER